MAHLSGSNAMPVGEFPRGNGSARTRELSLLPNVSSSLPSVLLGCPVVLGHVPTSVRVLGTPMTLLVLPGSSKTPPPP